MLGVFFVLVWVTVIAALTGHERRRSALLLSDNADGANGEAVLPTDDPVLLVRFYRLALSRELPAREEQLVRINLACAFNAVGDHEAGLEELDQVQLSLLSPQEMALWLNNRAYTLVFLSKPDDAIGHIDDAVELLHGDDGLAKDPLLLGCLGGTRGIAELHRKNYREAETALYFALRSEEESVVLQFDPEWNVDAGRTAERWYWLAEIAKNEGKPTEANRRYARAAAFGHTPFGKRAQAALSAGSGPMGIPALAKAGIAS